MDEKHCNICGSIIKIKGKSKTVSMCEFCSTELLAYQEAVEKEIEEYNRKFIYRSDVNES